LEVEFLAIEREVQTELLPVAKLLADYGPQLVRPPVDTLSRMHGHLCEDGRGQLQPEIHFHGLRRAAEPRHPDGQSADERLTNAFSKKAENHNHMMSIYFMHYNFVRFHKMLKMTPAMAAGVTAKLWAGVADMVKVLEIGIEQDAA